MGKTLIERRIIIILFILVLAIFSFAERDSKKLEQSIYSTHSPFRPFKMATHEAPVSPIAQP